jgi:hypothetical protein
MLISASLDRNVLLYQLPPGFSNEALDELLKKGCGLLHDYLNTNRDNVSNNQETSLLMNQTADFCESQPN